MFLWVWVSGKRELEVREQKLKTVREEKKLEIIWIHIKLIGVNSCSNHNFRLHSGSETEAARGQKSRLLNTDKCFNYICEELNLTITEVGETQTSSGRCAVQLNKTKSCSLGAENLSEKFVFTTESQFIKYKSQSECEI